MEFSLALNYSFLFAMCRWIACQESRTIVHKKFVVTGTHFAQCTDELERTREFIPKSDKKEILQKLFMFDTVTPMTQPERIAVYNAVLSGQETTVDVCWSAGHYLNEYRRNSRQSEECELPFDTSVEELVANLL